jgi:TonB family protein
MTKAYWHFFIALIGITTLAFSGFARTSVPIDFKQLISSKTPIFSKPKIVREINTSNNEIESTFYNGIVYLDRNDKKHPVVRSKKMQLFPLEMLSNDIVYCVNRIRQNGYEEDEYYLLNVNVVAKYDEISLMPAEFSLSSADFLSLFTNFNSISLSQLNCFFSDLITESSGNYTWSDEFQKQDFIQSKINQLNQNKYQTINQKKDYYVTLRGSLGEYDFQSNSFPVRVIYLSDFSPTMVNLPFNVGLDFGDNRDEIASGLFSSPTERDKTWKEFRQLDNIGTITYKIDPNLARGLVSRLNEDREVNLKLVLKSSISGEKENLNCSSGYRSSNRINFQIQSMNVFPAILDDDLESSEAEISPELEALLNDDLETNDLTESGQSGSSKYSNDEIFTSVEQQAEFPGGPRAFGAFLQRNLRYPAAAQRANVGGKVYVQFVVNTDGTIEDLEVLKSVGFGCDEEAIRVVKAVPRWTPGKLSGRAVRSRFTQPITFVLSE